MEEKKLLFLIITVLVTALLASLVFVLLRPSSFTTPLREVPRGLTQVQEVPKVQEEPVSSLPEGSSLWRFFTVATVLVPDTYTVGQADAGGASALVVHKGDVTAAVTLSLLSARDFETNEIVPFDQMIVRQMESFPSETGCTPLSVDDVAFVCRHGVDAKGVERYVYFAVYDEEHYLSLSWPASIIFSADVLRGIALHPTEIELLESQIPPGLQG